MKALCASELNDNIVGLIRHELFKFRFTTTKPWGSHLKPRPGVRSSSLEVRRWNIKIDHLMKQ